MGIYLHLLSSSSPSRKPCFLHETRILRNKLSTSHFIDGRVIFYSFPAINIFLNRSTRVEYNFKASIPGPRNRDKFGDLHIYTAVSTKVVQLKSIKAYATTPKGMMDCGCSLLHRQVHEFSARWKAVL